jgi:UDP-glucose 4-epimerase
MNILITGGFGYVGGRVAQHLVEKGHQVVLGSRKKQSSPDWLPQSEVVQLRWNDEAALAEICSGVNVVIHTTGMNAQDCASDPVAALEFNGLATAKLVRASRKTGVAKFIYFSTAHVYQSPLVGEINEDTCPRNLHPYATTHLAGENTVLYGSETATDFTGIVLRLSNVIGAPVHKNVNCWMLVVNDLCRQAMTTRRMIVKSNGKQIRDFVSMQSVCNYVDMILVASSINSLPSVINVGSGRSITIEELSSRIRERCEAVYGFRPEIQMSLVKNMSSDKALSYQTNFPSLSVSEDFSIESDIDETLHYCRQEWVT